MWLLMMLSYQLAQNNFMVEKIDYSLYFVMSMSILQRAHLHDV